MTSSLESIFSSRPDPYIARASKDIASYLQQKNTSSADTTPKVTPYEIPKHNSQSNSTYDAESQRRLEAINRWSDEAKLTQIFGREELLNKHSQASTNPSELERNWAVPTCMGTLLSADFDTEAAALSKEFPEKYEKLMEKVAERQNAIKKEYGLEGASREEFYNKTFGPQSKEMTEAFYNGFDDEAEELINFFFPDVAKKYNY